MRTRLSLAGMLVFVLFAWLPAQEQAEEEQAKDVKISPSGEIKIFTDLVIPEGEVRSGAVRVIGGNLTVAGRVTGRITVLGGDVELLPTARVEGTIVALGGKIHRSEEAQVTGDVLEVNRGKISLSKEEAEEIFGQDEQRDEHLERRDDEEEEEWEAEEVEDQWEHAGPHVADRHIHPDFEAIDDAIMRYNRSEGIAIYAPFHPDTDDIPGFHVYGYAGYAFGAGKWYGRLGIGEYLWRGRIGVLLEGHKEPRNDDGWRITSLENSLGAFFLHQDWYDWYEAEGYGGSLILAIPQLAELKVQYRAENHVLMPNVTNWSMFGGDKNFNPEYPITEGKDVNLKTQVTLGRSVGFFPRSLRMNLSYAYTQTMPGSGFEYTRDDATLEAFLPLHRRLGIRVAARTGSLSGDSLGLQHRVPLGGIGSVQGYSYKDLNDDGLAEENDHYATVQASFSLRKGHDLFSLVWHYGYTWDSPDRILMGSYFSDLTGGGYHAIGIAWGEDDYRFEFFRPLGKAKDWVFYFRILDF